MLDGWPRLVGFVMADLRPRWRPGGLQAGSGRSGACDAGSDDGTPAKGRGWAALGTAGRLVGHIFINKGDDSGFVAKRE
ncbi:MAG: hypothetical protein JO107_14080 [Hyphomicrobiales bacterium]|nr:hypothetical protein [Hyphomicrobiales bacterium]